MQFRSIHLALLSLTLPLAGVAQTNSASTTSTSAEIPASSIT